MPFAEKKDYKPKVKIEYVDNRGRLLDAKEVGVGPICLRVIA